MSLELSPGLFISMSQFLFCLSKCELGWLSLTAEGALTNPGREEGGSTREPRSLGLVGGASLQPGEQSAGAESARNGGAAAGPGRWAVSAARAGAGAGLVAVEENRRRVSRACSRFEVKP